MHYFVAIATKILNIDGLIIGVVMGCYGNRLHYTQHSAFDLVSTAWYGKHVHMNSAVWL